MRFSGVLIGAPIIRLETSFDGGKTHDAIALWHICKKGKQIQKLEQFANLNSNRPIQVVAIACHNLDPINRAYHAETGITALWDEIAYQSGK